MGVIPTNTSVAQRSETVCRCLQSPLAGAHNDEGPTGACPEGLLPGGNPAVRGEDTSPWCFPRDLSGMNLTSWAGLIQDVAQGMKVVPPNLAMEVCLDSMVLLQLLEATTGMGYCRICCQPSPRCRCLGDYQPAPTETWSQMMARMPGQGVVASVGGPTTPGTATAEVQEQGVQWAPALPIQVLSAPQGMLPVRQPRPHQSATPYQQAVQPQSQPATPYEQAAQPSSQPATPYQQAVQPPRRLAGRGLLAQPLSDRAAPAPDQSIPNCGRQQARGQGIRGRSVSRPGRG